MRPEKCNMCGSVDMIVGRAQTQTGKDIFPHYCGNCGCVTTTQASKAEVAAFIAENGPPARVYTSTEIKMMNGEDVSRPSSAAHVGPCVVCASTDRVEIHHWAPYHLFGTEADKWPHAALCQKCHSRWHRIVTPDMGKRKGLFRQQAEALRDARFGKRLGDA